MSIDRWMDIVTVLHVLNRILLGHKKEQIWVSWTEVDEPKACYTEWNQLEKQIWYINTYIWNLEKWHWWTCSQDINRDAEVENGLVDTEREGEVWMNWKSSINVYVIVVQLCPTLCNPMDCCTPGFPVLHHLPEFAQTHVHWVSDAIQPSHPLSSPSPPAFNLSQHQGLFQ